MLLLTENILYVKTSDICIRKVILDHTCCSVHGSVGWFRQKYLTPLVTLWLWVTSLVHMGTEQLDAFGAKFGEDIHDSYTVNHAKFSCSTTMRLIFLVWNVLSWCSNYYWVNCHDTWFRHLMLLEDKVDPLTFPPAPSAGRNLYLSNIFACDQIPAEPITFPSASGMFGAN